MRTHVNTRLIVVTTAAPHETSLIFFKHSSARPVLLDWQGYGRLKISFAASAAALDKMPGDLQISADTFA